MASANTGEASGWNSLKYLPVTSEIPVAFGAMTTLAIALLAASVPARRPAPVDPVEALRHE